MRDKGTTHFEYAEWKINIFGVYIANQIDAFSI